MRLTLPHVLLVKGRPDLVKLGTDYGGWIVPRSSLRPGAICYSAGLGEDGSFDRELAANHGLHVYAFDPTPRAIVYAREAMSDVQNWELIPVGLWNCTTELRFYEPKNPAHVSHSALNLQGTSRYFEAPVKPVSSFMAEFGHQHLDILKMDIEGAEFAVLGNLIHEGVFPTVICVEFDQPVSVRKIVEQVRALRRAEYDLVAVDGWNYSFVRR